MEYSGRQVFIIHPDDEFRDETVAFLRAREYETFGFKGDGPVVLDESRDVIVFVSSPEDGPWDCRAVKDIFPRGAGSVRIVALGGNAESSCFDAVLEGSPDEIRSGILDFLERSDARGHRFFVRFGNQHASIATFEFHDEGRRFAGIIHDVSVRGVSCTFRPEPEGPIPMQVDGMRLNLPGHRCVVRGRMTSRRVAAGQIIHVFMFEQSLPDSVIKGIQEFIYDSLSMKLSAH